MKLCITYTLFIINAYIMDYKDIHHRSKSIHNKAKKHTSNTTCTYNINVYTTYYNSPTLLMDNWAVDEIRCFKHNCVKLKH